MQVKEEIAKRRRLCRRNVGGGGRVSVRYGLRMENVTEERTEIS